MDASEPATSDGQQQESTNKGATPGGQTSKLEEERRIEKAFWKANQILYPAPAPRRSVERPSRRWWIENAPILPLEHPHHLCKMCRHIDFHSLVHSPLEQIFEELTLSPLKLVFENRNCAFCRLLTSTIK